jgi:hypothetical protein
MKSRLFTEIEQHEKTKSRLSAEKRKHEETKRQLEAERALRLQLVGSRAEAASSEAFGCTGNVVVRLQSPVMEEEGIIIEDAAASSESLILGEMPNNATNRGAAANESPSPSPTDCFSTTNIASNPPLAAASETDGGQQVDPGKTLNVVERVHFLIKEKSKNCFGFFIF